MRSEQILDIEDRLIHLALDGDSAAAQEFADLNRLRREWQRTKSTEAFRQLVSQAQTAKARVSARYQGQSAPV
jgi:hypothetical protein